MDPSEALQATASAPTRDTLWQALMLIDDEHVDAWLDYVDGTAKAPSGEPYSAAWVHRALQHAVGDKVRISDAAVKRWRRDGVARLRHDLEQARQGDDT